MEDFVIWILGLFAVIVLMRYLSWLIFSPSTEKKDKTAHAVCNLLKDLIDGQWSKRPKPVFVMGEFEGSYKERKVIYKIVESKLPWAPTEVYLLLKPGISLAQSTSSPSMSFYFTLKKYPQLTEHTYLKSGWLVYKPKLSHKVESAEEFYMDKGRLIQALEELTRAAEILEKRGQATFSKPGS